MAVVNRRSKSTKGLRSTLRTRLLPEGEIDFGRKRKHLETYLYDIIHNVQIESIRTTDVFGEVSSEPGFPEYLKPRMYDHTSPAYFMLGYGATRRSEYVENLDAQRAPMQVIFAFSSGGPPARTPPCRMKPR